MLFLYFLCVPELPQEIAHQSNQVQIVKYLLPERSLVDVGTPVAVVRNWWAVITVKANGKGFLRRTIFEPGDNVKIGDPIAVIAADGDDIPHGREPSLLEITEHIRLKPAPERKRRSDF